MGRRIRRMTLESAESSPVKARKNAVLCNRCPYYKGD